MGLDDLGKAVNSYKKWFTSITDKADIYINDAIESMGDPFKYNGLTNNLRKSSINNLTDYLKDIQEYKESSIKQINSAFSRAQKMDRDIIDEIRPLYQQALDRINTSVENVSIYEQQLAGLKNAEKYKEGTKAFNRGFDNVRGEELVKQEMEIEDIWDKDSKAQQRLYDDANKRYTQTYHPEIDTHGYYFSEENSSFLNDDAIKQYEALKQMAPGMIITEQSYNWETDIDRAHELALRENNQFDFVRQAEERERRRVNNNTNSTTTQNQVNNTTVQNQVNREQKKRRKSYADRKTKPINSEFNTTFYGRYDPQTRTYEYPDYKSHYSGGVSRSVYDEEWIAEKTFGEAHSSSEYGIESPWSTNRVRNTNVPDIPNTPDVPDTSSAPRVRKLKNATKSYRPEIKMEGNNIEIDSIYNYSTPKKLNPGAGDNKNGDQIEVPDPEPETTPQSDIPNSEPEVETAEQTVDNTNLNNTVDNFDVPNGYDLDPTTWTDEDIADMADGDPDLYQELLNRREQARGGDANTDSANTDSNKFANDPNDPTTWSDDYIEEMSEGDPHYYEELRQRREKAFEETINSQGSKPPGPFSDNFDPNDPSTWTDNDRRRMNTPDQWTDDDIRRLADGDMDRADELNRMRNGEFGPYGHNPINDFDFNDAPVPDTSYKHAPDTEILDNSISTKTLSKMDVAMTGFNIIGAIGDYKSYRREGSGVISAGIKTGAKFAIEEALGFWALPIALVKTVPGMAIKGADALYKENRRMNSAANFTLFGDAQFMDTQQLATMRQSGMEMAKMSQYNLQQTLMGNEATYLHR